MHKCFSKRVRDRFQSHFLPIRGLKMVICLVLILLQSAWCGAEEAQKPRKTLLVLSSIGGGGHLAACNALETFLGDEYDLKVIYPINELRIWGVPAGEQFFNMMLKNGWIRSMNFIARHLAPSLFRARQSKLEAIIETHVRAHHPDLLISLIPFVNFPASEAARKSGIPFLLITTDNDLSNWSLELEKVTHPLMKITIGTELPKTREVLLQKGVLDACIEITGLPLRGEFIQQKDREEICQSFHFPHDQRRILIMMGGAGGQVAYDYAEAIGAMPLGIHLIVVAGRNVALRRQLETLAVHPSNTFSVFGYMNRVSDLMAVSDVLVTKPGPGTINEAIAMHLPMLIDHTGTSLFWERSNVDIVLKGGVGEKVKQLSQLESLLIPYLTDLSVKERVHHAFMGMPPNQFHLRIPGIVRELINANTSQISISQSEQSSQEAIAPLLAL
jgi:processive 1,2-diacylglycerol beta-glucosyltransferase